MNAMGERLVNDYLERLDDALGDLPDAERREIVEEIAEHIAVARADLAPDDEAGLRTLLGRLGDPEQIAADAHERSAPAQTRRGWPETLAIILLLAGGFVAGVGWLAGAVLLWLSPVWTLRDKLIGTLVVPGGLALPVTLLAFAGTGSGSSGVCQAVVVPRNAIPAGSLAHCTHTGGTSSAHAVLWIALFVVLVVAPVATSVYLGRRSRRPVAA
jgi:uncharacterized membrane protein